MFIEVQKIYSPNHPEIDDHLKIAAIDLDDILADSIPGWINFVNTSYYVRNHKIPFFINLQQMKKTIPYYYYRELKGNYRKSEIKKNLPVITGAKDFLSGLKELGYKIVIMTARKEPSLKLTVEWLDKNNLYYDELVLDKNKHIKILQRYPNLNFMVEDNRTVANLVASWGYKVYLLNNIYNHGNLHERVTRVYPDEEEDCFIQILELVSEGEKQ